MNPAPSRSYVIKAWPPETKRAYLVSNGEYVTRLRLRAARWDDRALAEKAAAGMRELNPGWRFEVSL